VERHSSGLDDGLTVVVNEDGVWMTLAGLPYVYHRPASQPVPDEAGREPRPFSIADWPGAGVRLADEGSVLSRNALLFEFLLPGLGSVRSWLDEESGLLLQEERFDMIGRPLSVTVRSDLHFPDELPAELFTMKRPPEQFLVDDIHLFRRFAWLHKLQGRLPFRPLIPRNPPPSFQVDRVELIHRGGVPVAVIRLSGPGRDRPYGVRAVSIYQSRPATSGGEDRTMWVREGSVHVLYRRIDDIEIAIAGAADRQEALSIFDSLAYIDEAD